ncbi:VOC family protein [Halioglobus sp. HI00S01]|uniref:VOC family protein n=1 Tax=Halioglobus sp. HI00S01 TaxID=1822214 RepID=UPI0008249242|nr:VOC family protein [Halioglobus sp. HI00S01]
MNRILCGLAMLLTVAACSMSSINEPAISSGSERLAGKVIWHELLTDTPAETERFYAELLGWEFRSLPHANLNYRMIYNEGRPIGGLIDQTQLPTSADISQWVSLLSVYDIAAATDAVTSGGGTVYTPPTSLGDRGEIAVVADNQGVLFALLQTQSGDPADGDDIRPGDFLWDELWAEDASAAAAFYKRLAPLSVSSIELDPEGARVDYKVLSSQGQRRFGIRTNPVAELPSLWLQYLRITDKAKLEEVVVRVESLGGKVLLPVTERPSQGHMAIIAGPSGAGIGLQTWDDKNTSGGGDA